MTKTRVPLDPDGYAVNAETGTIHTRYASHGNGTRTRTEKGVMTLLNGQDGKPCQICYPSPRYTEPPRPPQQRRIPTWARQGEMTLDEE
jgi:hypothetical protein